MKHMDVQVLKNEIQNITTQIHDIYIRTSNDTSQLPFDMSVRLNELIIKRACLKEQYNHTISHTGIIPSFLKSFSFKKTMPTGKRIVDFF